MAQKEADRRVKNAITGLNPAVFIVTSFSPHPDEKERQRAALATWQAAGFKALSLNLAQNNRRKGFACAGEKMNCMDCHYIYPAAESQNG